MNEIREGLVLGTDTEHYKEIVEIHLYKGDNGLYDLWIGNALYHDATWDSVLSIIESLNH